MHWRVSTRTSPVRAIPGDITFEHSATGPALYHSYHHPSNALSDSDEWAKVSAVRVESDQWVSPDLAGTSLVGMWDALPYRKHPLRLSAPGAVAGEPEFNQMIEVGGVGNDQAAHILMHHNQFYINMHYHIEQYPHL